MKTLKDIILNSQLFTNQKNIDLIPTILVPQKTSNVFILSANHICKYKIRSSYLLYSYILGNIKIKNSILYSSDIRGDELKSHTDNSEKISIKNSLLLNTLVHNKSQNQKFDIKNTISFPYSNIHGAPVDSSILHYFATIDLTEVKQSTIGKFSYIQTGTLDHQEISPGTIWIKTNNFEFLFQHSKHTLDTYLGKNQCGKIYQLLYNIENKLIHKFICGKLEEQQKVNIPPSSSISSLSIYENINIKENVFISQRAYVHNSSIGIGSNIQENCIVSESRLKNCVVIAHGAKLIHTIASDRVFVGFNSFLQGTKDYPIYLGQGSIVCPHTIIDAEETIHIPDGHLVWGIIKTQSDLKNYSISLQELMKIKTIKKENFIFNGSGQAFVQAFTKRIEHILKENGAFFSYNNSKGHAQKNKNFSYIWLTPSMDKPVNLNISTNNKEEQC